MCCISFNHIIKTLLDNTTGHSPVTFLLDSGATMSVVRLDAIASEFRDRITKDISSTPVGANGSPLDVVGQIKIPVSIGTFKTDQVFVVVSKLTVDCLLGVDYLIANEVIINYKRHCVVIKGNEIPFTLTKGIASTVQSSQCCTTTVFETTVIPGRSIQLIEIALPDEVRFRSPLSALIEPLATAKLPQHLLAVRTLSPVLNNHALIQIMNMSPTSVKLYQGTKIGEATPLADVCLVETQNSNLPALNTCELPDIDLTGSTMSPAQHQELLALLNKYVDLFATEDDPLGRTSVVRHTIHTDSPPIRQPVRRQPVALQSTIHSEIQKMMQQGVIQHSFSPWSSPVVMVKNKDGAWRFCIDYRKLNGVTHRDAYPLPRIDATLDSLAGATLFTTLDLASGYWQVEVDPCDKEKTAFSTSQGHFEFNVMPFGLTNAPTTFQRLMECILAGLSGEQCLIYLDDVIIFSATFEEHLKRLGSVFERFRSAGLKLKLKKCQFAQKSVTYLGHIISNKGIEPDKAKLEAVINYPKSASSKEVKQFVGLSNYYRRFIPGYARIAEPLHQFLRKNSKGFHWTSVCDSSFNTLKS